MHVPTKIEAKAAPTLLGVANAPLSFSNHSGAPSSKKTIFKRARLTPTVVTSRRLRLDGEDAFDLSFWCGTCPLVFERLVGANRTLSSAQLQDVLNAGMRSIRTEVLEAASELVPEGTYLPLLLTVHPWLVSPSGSGDYFTEEQVAHVGIDNFWGLPENPRTPYYRGSSWSVSEHESLFEFVVPMVPPTWNDRGRVAHYEAELKGGGSPTILALSVLDHTQPHDSADAHRGLMHFVLDGHHKLEAAARARKPVNLLSLLSYDHSLASREDLDRLVPIIESQPKQLR